MQCKITELFILGEWGREFETDETRQVCVIYLKKKNLNNLKLYQHHKAPVDVQNAAILLFSVVDIMVQNHKNT